MFSGLLVIDDVEHFCRVEEDGVLSVDGGDSLFVYQVFVDSLRVDCPRVFWDRVMKKPGLAEGSRNLSYVSFDRFVGGDYVDVPFGGDRRVGLVTRLASVREIGRLFGGGVRLRSCRAFCD